MQSLSTFEKVNPLIGIIRRSALLLCVKPLIHYPLASSSSSERDAASAIANCAAIPANA